MSETIGFIGVGTMGGGIAANLAKAGKQLLVYDALPENAQRLAALEGVSLAESPRAVAEQCKVVFTCLPDNSAVEAVYRGEEGLMQGLSEGSITCDFSTITPELVQALHGELAAKGVAHLEAPMLGSKPQAAAGEIFCIMGGDPEAYERLKPLLDIPTKLHMLVGPAGSGAKVKLIHNALGALNYSAVAEALALCAANKVDPHTFYEVVCNGGGMAFGNYFQRKVPTIIEGNYDVRFKLALAHKDGGLARGLAEQAGVEVPLMRMAWGNLDAAMEAGYGEEDASAVTRIVEQRTGQKIGGK